VSEYDDVMALFTLDGATYEYLLPDPGHPGETRSWEHGNYPKVMVTLPLAGGRTVDVYALAERWNPSHILASWEDDDRRPHWSWIPAGNVRRVTDSEWDIWEYRRCPPQLRDVRWSDRLPGFLPA
jgi:hypothetical protein